jgi:hypothetical protein
MSTEYGGRNKLRPVRVRGRHQTLVEEILSCADQKDAGPLQALEVLEDRSGNHHLAAAYRSQLKSET